MILALGILVGLTLAVPASAGSLGEALRERLTVRVTLENETAFRFHRPRTAQKVETSLTLDAEYAASEWLDLHVLFRTMGDPHTRLTRKNDFDLRPRVLWEEGDYTRTEFRELFADLYWGDFELRVGRQLILWGQTIGLQVLDQINPQDLREFILKDIVNRSIPLWGARGQWTREDWALEGFILLDFEQHRLAQEGTDFELRNIRLPPLPPLPTKIGSDEPDDFDVDDAQVGVRVSHTGREVDFSLVYLYRYDHVPNVKRIFQQSPGLPFLILTEQYARLHVFGGSLSYAAESLVFHVEGFVSRGNEYEVDDLNDRDGLIQRGAASYALVVDWPVRPEIFLSAQLFQQIILSSKARVFRDRVQSAGSLYLRGEFLNDTLAPEILLFVGLDDLDYWIRAGVRYAVTDRLSVNVGVDLFTGESRGPFGQFKNQDRATLGFEYTFEVPGH